MHPRHCRCAATSHLDRDETGVRRIHYPRHPEGDFKRYCYFRNRGYLTRKYRNLRWFSADIIGFPYYFLKTGDLKGLAHWFRAYSTGFRGKGFGSPAELMSTNS
jgi:rhamnopyranosyl-N-acetylglucosaminyl-diphospho-decaprenol beta-1,3/1,4-galactofuranosyltransferase